MKNIKCIYLFTVVCIFLLYACSSKTDQKKFFDVPGYFKTEIDSIKSNYTTVSKTSVYNGDTNRQKLQVVDVNWEKEFALFLECDINKPVYYANMSLGGAPAWHGPPEEAKQWLSYSANSPKLSIQFVVIGKKNENVVSVGIRISKANLISVTNIDAEYEKGVGYSISGEQKIKNLGDKNTFFVEGKFN